MLEIIVALGSDEMNERRQRPNWAGPGPYSEGYQWIGRPDRQQLRNSRELVAEAGHLLAAATTLLQKETLTLQHCLATARGKPSLWPWQRVLVAKILALYAN